MKTRSVLFTKEKQTVLIEVIKFFQQLPTPVLRRRRCDGPFAIGIIVFFQHLTGSSQLQQIRDKRRKASLIPARQHKY